MTVPDAINGLFEASGAGFIMLSIRKLLADRSVRGVSWVHVGFFSAWGIWNVYYYPHLGQWLSFAGGLAIVTANTVYTGMLIHFSRSPK